MPENNNKIGLFLVSGILLLLLFASKASGAPSTANLSPLVARYGRDRVNWLIIVADALKEAGFNYIQMKLALAQVAHETGFFNEAISPFARNINFSGIMWINNAARQKNASKGSPFPASEGAYFYAKFDTPLDWAIDYKRILSMNPGKPIEQTNVDNWVAGNSVNGLVQNHYFTDSGGNYERGMKRWFDLLTDVGI